MKINITTSIRRICAAALPFALLAPLHAVEPTPWDSLNKAYGVVTVKMKRGENLKRTDFVTFTATDMSFAQAAISIPRQDVQEVLIREVQKEPWGWLLNRQVLHSYLFTGGTRFDLNALILLPIGLSLGAVTLVPWIAYEGARRLKPTKVLYKVVP